MGGEDAECLLMPVSLVQLPPPESLLLQTDAELHCSLCSQGLLRACQQQGTNKCLLNKLMEMFLHIKHDMLLKNSICAQLCRCASIVGYFNYIQLFLCSVYEVDCGSNIIKLIRVAS